jgi:hypothetical protein
MRIAHGVGALALVALAAMASSLPAQQPVNPADSGVTSEPGPVMRVSYYRVNPGMGQEFQRDLRQHLVPIWEAQKAAGIILGYTVATNQTTDSPDDWNVVFAVTYANWAALDSLGARSAAITLRHYGTAQARTAVGNGRNAFRTLVRSSLMRVQNISRSPRP